MKSNKINKNIYVTKPTLPSLWKYKRKLKEIWKSNILTNNGPMSIRFTNQLKKQLKVKNLELFCNGHLSLESALKSLDLEVGGEIITTPFTFVSTTSAIVNCGFKPVFCDIKESDMTIDEEKIEKLITKKTVAILAVHVYGNPCNVEKIDEIAKKHNLAVIYDAAHAFNVFMPNGKNITEYGDVSMISFHATKVFHSIEGGCVISNKRKYAKNQQLIRNFGIETEEEIGLIAGNAKMNEFQAAMGLCNLRKVEKNINKRKNIFNMYIENLKEIDGIRLPMLNPNIKNNYAYFPILINKKSRDELYTYLMEKRIYARKYFHPLIPNTKAFKDKKYKGGDKCPIAQKIGMRILTLPLYPDLTSKEVKYICDSIKEYFNSKNDLVVIGGGGHAKVLLDIAKNNGINVFGVLADKDENNKTNYARVGTFDYNNDDKNYILGFGDIEARIDFVKKHSYLSYETLIDKRSIVNNNEIGEGTVVMPSAVLNHDCIIGKHVIINTAVIVEHDCVVSDFCHISPNATLSGGVEVGEGSWVGVGAVIKDHVKIGKNVIVGAGAVVISDIPDDSIVVGNPAKIIKKR